MFDLPESSLIVLAEKLPSTEALVRLEDELKKVQKIIESGENSSTLISLSGTQVDKVIFEVIEVIKSPLGFELFIAILPTLVEISKQGSRAKRFTV